MEKLLRTFRERLYLAFFNWLDVNREVIGDRWYSDLRKKGKDAEADCDTGLKIMGNSMWIFNMIANLGVAAGLGPNQVNFQGLAKGLDKPSTMRLLHLIAACMSIQFLPKETIEKSFPIISAKKFSLKLYAEVKDR